MAKKRTSTRSTGRATPRRRSQKRERIAPRGDVRYVRRTPEGQFDESDDAGRSLQQDRRHKARTSAKAGQGDRGDRKSR